VRVATAIVAGLALALLVVGLSLYPMLHPTYTKLLSQRYSQVAESGLTQSRVLFIAEQVREFVADGDVSSLPATVDGRPGFDEAAVSHLRDVRKVLDGARTFTGVLAALVVVWLGIEIARRRFAVISSAMIAGAAWCLVIVVLGGVAGTMNFEALFTWFHGLFFSAGTWQFAADSLLIEVFPEGFWIAAGVTWGALILVGAGVLGVGGWLMRGAETHPLPRRANDFKVNGA
jgi:integral membrane protein (TIGR01906 family)